MSGRLGGTNACDTVEGDVGDVSPSANSPLRRREHHFTVMTAIYLRRASVTVFIRNGLNSATSSDGDITVLETHIKAHH